MKAARHIVLAVLLFAAACEEKPAPAPVKPSVRVAPAPVTPSQAPVPVAAPLPGTSPASPPATPVPPPVSPVPAATPGTVSVMGLSFSIPEGWKSVPPANSMRLAELQVADPAGDATKACTAVFSTAGGDVKANIDRWAGQVRDASGQPGTPVIKTRLLESFSVHIVELTGAYSPGMGDTTNRDNWMLRGAIIPAPSGLLFIKMTGPAQAMAATTRAFDDMLESLKTK